MFHHTQSIDANGRIRSVQTLTVPSVPLHPEAGARYFEHLRQTLWPVLHVKHRPDGGVELRAFGVLLLSFAKPETVQANGMLSIRYPIEAGFFVQPHRHHEGYLEVGMGPDRLSLTVDGYFGRIVGPHGSRLRKLLYLLTQSALHVRAARGFLTNLATQPRE